MKYDYKGNAVTGSSANSVQAVRHRQPQRHHAFSKNLKLTAGINNLFDKRLYREGNAVSASSTAIYGTSGGAGAATYNEPGRTYYVSLTTSFWIMNERAPMTACIAMSFMVLAGGRGGQRRRSLHRTPVAPRQRADRTPAPHFHSALGGSAAGWRVSGAVPARRQCRRAGSH